MTLEQAIQFFGGITKTALALGLRPSTVSEWQHTGIPEGRQYQIEMASCGALQADKPARRDGVVLRNSDCPKEAA